MGRPAKFDRQEILEASMQLFWRRGYESTSLRDLLEHTGLGRQSLYRAFGDKESLFKEAINYYAQIQLQMNTAILTNPDVEPLERVNNLFLRWEGMVAEGMTDGCMMVNSITELGQVSPQLAQMCHDHLQNLEGLLQTCLSEAASAGALSANSDPESLGRWLLVVIKGLAVSVRTEKKSEFVSQMRQTTMAVLRNL